MPAAFYGISKNTPSLGSLSEFWFEIASISASTAPRSVTETVEKRTRHSNDAVHYDRGEAADDSVTVLATGRETVASKTPATSNQTSKMSPNGYILGMSQS